MPSQHTFTMPRTPAYVQHTQISMAGNKHRLLWTISVMRISVGEDWRILTISCHWSSTLYKAPTSSNLCSTQCFPCWEFLRNLKLITDPCSTVTNSTPSRNTWDSNTSGLLCYGSKRMVKQNASCETWGKWWKQQWSNSNRGDKSCTSSSETTWQLLIHWLMLHLPQIFSTARWESNCRTRSHKHRNPHWTQSCQWTTKMRKAKWNHMQIRMPNASRKHCVSTTTQERQTNITIQPLSIYSDEQERNHDYNETKWSKHHTKCITLQCWDSPQQCILCWAWGNMQQHISCGDDYWTPVIIATEEDAPSTRCLWTG